jgi:glucose-6-phosphate isomerase
MDLHFDSQHAEGLVSAAETRQKIGANEALIEGVLRGSVWNERALGWFSTEDSAPEAELERIQAEADRVRAMADVMVVIGIGGSNRGAMAAIQALRRRSSPGPRIVFAGDSLSASRLKDAVETVRNESVVLNVIAKDFNTVEPGIAFRVLREAMVAKYGAAYSERIVVTGSHGSGQLLELARQHGYRRLEFPASIGGRFSVLSAVGLFPMAVAGIDIRAMVDGARNAERELKGTEPYTNPAVLYAVDRSILFSKGYIVESLVVFEPDLVPLSRWWTQLAAETEGKSQEAVFPTSFVYSEDLHAVGQYVQQGKRCLIETYLGFFHADPDLVIHGSASVHDGFDYLDGRPFDELNRAVYSAALEAHSGGGVPCLALGAPSICERSLGELFYFFMFASYLSASLLGVNPFTQDGVEGYKANMYRLLGKQS